jgi:ABC-type protease/lipase transport system fused ATPase/permease subunit
LPATILANLNQCIRWLAQAGLPTLGAMLLLSNEITIGGFIAGLIIGGKTFMPVDALIGNLDSFKKMTHFFKAIKPILNTAIDNDPAYQAKLKGNVVIQDLKLKQAHQFNLTANSGDTVALVGPTGSGQDSVIRQLMRYEPVDSGVIMIDGVRLEDWDKNYLSQSIGFVSGSILLPEVSIKSLITSFGQVTTTAAIQAAERTGLNGKLIEWDLSYDDIFKIDTISPSLSQSLRQLIALTAALATNPQLYVMENPETHLDMDSMSLLKGILIQEKQRGKTIILSTQSRSLLQLAEHMVLLNNGKTLFKGEPNEFETVKNTMTDQRGLQNMNAFYASNQPSMNEHAGVRQ